VSELLPLFPLDLVLFPGATLPLHIFEPRYKEMIGECLASHSLFGVVRAKEKGVAEVGCGAEIAQLVTTYDDGRMDILTQGRRRFQVVELDEERSFLRARVEWFDDEGGEAEPDQRQRLLDLHTRLLALTGAESPPADPAQPMLSFELAAALPLDLDFKQALLGLRSEPQRVTALLDYYQAILPRLQQAVRTRQKAGGNGHSH
jgi:Lon protease-like protein